MRRPRRPSGPGRSGDPRDTGGSETGGEGSTDGGFILLESLLSITLLAIIMAALTTFSITVTNSTNYQRQRQAAVQLANSTLEQVRGLTARDLSLGRTAAQTNAQFTAASTVVGPWLTSMTQTADPAATATSTPTLAVATSSTLNGTVFTSTSYLGWCSVPTDTSTGTDCTPASASTAGYLRAVVAVTWAGTRCPAGTCTYVTSTLVSTDDDPVFVLKQAAPTAPVVTNPGNQASYVGDTSSTAGVTNLPLQLQLTTGTGVAPTTWQAVGLPAGLTVNTTGLISGSPTTAGAAVTVTVTATDAFLRSATATFTWTVYTPVSGSNPPNQSSVVNSTAVSLALTATGGSSASYTWTDPTKSLPPGLVIGTDGKSVTGTPTATGTYTVILTVTDSSGRKDDTLPFTWTVVYPPPTAAAADRTSTVNSSVSAPFTATGGSGGPYSWTDPTGSLPVGLTVSTSGLVTGTPTAVGVRAVKLRVTDTKSGRSVDVLFTWTIAAVPSVNGMTDPFRTSPGAAITAQALTYTCPTASCSLTLTGAPTGIGIAPDTTSTPGTLVTVTATSGPVYLRGTVAASTAPGGYTLKVTPLDTTGNVVGTANTAAWTVSSPPTVTGLTTPFRITAGAAVANQTLPFTCPSGSCTLALTGAPSGIGLSATTGGAVSTSLSVTAMSGSSIYLRGTVAPSTAASSFTVTVTPTDTTTSTAGSPNQAAWTVQAPPTVSGLPPTYSAAQGSTIPATALPFTCPSAACTITLTGAPAGVGIAPDATSAAGATVTVTAPSGNLYLSGTLSRTATVTSYPVAVVPTDTTTSVVGTGTSTSLTVTARCTAAQSAAYSNAVAFDAPSLWYRLGETTGTAATDAGSARQDGVYAGGPTLGVAGALSCDPSTAISLNGTSSQVTSSANAVATPDTFSVEAWFATTIGGGKIIGFGSSQTGPSSTSDRNVYLTDTGQVVFGVNSSGNALKTILSPSTYLDGNYHHVVATMSSAGMVLYVDGASVGTDPNTKGKNPTGWWRVGYDTLNGWPYQPTRSFFTGSLDEVAVYPTALTAGRVAAHYSADR